MQTKNLIEKFYAKPKDFGFKFYVSLRVILITMGMHTKPSIASLAFKACNFCNTCRLNIAIKESF